jgi:hypothetical protein
VVTSNPGVPAWRALHARILADAGELEPARRVLLELAENGFAALPRDGNWIAALTQLAQVSAIVGDAGCAERLRKLLAPFADRIATVGLATACLGSVHRSLAGLAATMSDRSGAIAHLEAALVANASIGAEGWLAHCRLELAELLELDDPRGAELRAAAQETADRLELPAVTHRLRALV